MSSPPPCSAASSLSPRGGLGLRVVCLPFDPQRRCFPDGLLQDMARGLEVVEVQQQILWSDDEPPVWALLLLHRSPGAPAAPSPPVPEPSPPAKRRTPQPGGPICETAAPSQARRAAEWRAELEPAAQERFDRLAAWRTERARRAVRAPYLILGNRSLAEIAAAEPQDLAGLAALYGLGPTRLEAYGAELLQVLAAP